MKAAAHPKCVAWGHVGQSRFDDMASVRYRKITLLVAFPLDTLVKNLPNDGTTHDCLHI